MEKTKETESKFRMLLMDLLAHLKQIKLSDQVFAGTLEPIQALNLIEAQHYIDPKYRKAFKLAKEIAVDFELKKD